MIECPEKVCAGVLYNAFQNNLALWVEFGLGSLHQIGRHLNPSIRTLFLFRAWHSIIVQFVCLCSKSQHKDELIVILHVRRPACIFGWLQLIAWAECVHGVSNVRMYLVLSYDYNGTITLCVYRWQAISGKIRGCACAQLSFTMHPTSFIYGFFSPCAPLYCSTHPMPSNFGDFITVQNEPCSKK